MKEQVFETATLACGLRIIRQPSPTDVVYCGYAIGAGTRHEKADEYGLAHFVEHMIFKGTAKRCAWHILNRMENVGGELNAYTAKEETIVYAICLKHDFTRALELLTDITFHSTFPEREIPREREVILEEIASYADSPSELIFDEFEDVLFPDHPLGHNILGTPRSVRRFGSADAKRFTDKYYRPTNAVLFVSGNVPMTRIVAMAERLMSDFEAVSPSEGHQGSAVASALPLSKAEPSVVVRHRHTHQAHVLTGCRAFPIGDARRTGLSLLNNLLGGPGMNSRLNLVLREHLGLVYTIESNLTGYTDTGVFNIYFGCDEADADRCLQLVHTELQRLIDEALTPRQLTAARKQLVGQLGVAADNFESSALAMGKVFLHTNRADTSADVLRRLDALTPAYLQEIAATLFSPSQITTLIYK